MRNTNSVRPNARRGVVVETRDNLRARCTVPVAEHQLIVVLVPRRAGATCAAPLAAWESNVTVVVVASFYTMRI